MNVGSTVVEVIPLEDVNGQVRVSGTRVPIDTVVISFQEGATAEEIVERYPSLSLADVYSVIGYYLKHQQEVDKYLHQQQEISRQIRSENESRFNSRGIRERLLARKKSNDKRSE